MSSKNTTNIFVKVHPLKHFQYLLLSLISDILNLRLEALRETTLLKGQKITDFRVLPLKVH